MTLVVENQYSAVGKKVASVDIGSVVVPTSSDRAIYVIISCSQRNNAGGLFPTAVAWDAAGVNEAFTLIGEAENAKLIVSIWRLKAPTEKTAIVTVTWPSTQGNWNHYGLGVEVLSGVDQTTPEKTWQTPSTGAGIAAAHTITADSGNLAYDIVTIANSDALTENGPGVEVWNLTGGGARGASASHVSTVGDVAMAWTLTTFGSWLHGGVAIIPASAGGLSPIDGTLAATSTFAGTIFNIGVELIDGTVAATSSLSGTLKGLGPIDGSLNAISTMSGTLKGKTSMSGTAAFVSSMAATLIGTGILIGTISASSSMSGTAFNAGVERIDGSIAFTSSLSGTLKGLGPIDGVAAFSSSMSGTLFNAGVELIDGSIAFTSSLSGTLKGIGSIDGTAAASSSFAGTLKGLGPIDGSLDATSIFAGTLKGIGSIDGSLDATSTFAGTLKGLGPIDGSLDALSSFAGTLKGLGPIDGVAAFSSSMSGTLFNAGVERIDGSFTAISSISGTLKGLGRIDGSLAASSIFDATIFDSAAAVVSPIDGLLESVVSISGVLANVGLLTIQAPDAAWDGEGLIPWFAVKNDSGSTNSYKVYAQTGQLLDGAASVTFNTAREFQLWVADGIGVTASAKWIRII